jgi:hypothetical protein
MSARRAALLAAVSLPVIALSAVADAQDETEPPCPPAVSAGASIRASGGAGTGGPLIATQTIFMEVETADGRSPDFKAELPPGAVARRSGRAFQSDAPGPVHVRATWSDFDPVAGSFCQAGAEETFQLEAPRPLRYFPPKRSTSVGADGTVWMLLVPARGDLRPVEVRLRGVKRHRAPRASAPPTVLTFGLRDGDRGLTYGGRAIRVVQVAGWHFDVTFGNAGKLVVQMRDHRGRRPYGIDVQIVQAGRLIGHSRFVGRCGAYGLCSRKPVR